MQSERVPDSECQEDINSECDGSETDCEAAPELGQAVGSGIPSQTSLTVSHGTCDWMAVYK